MDNNWWNMSVYLPYSYTEISSFHARHVTVSFINVNVFATGLLEQNAENPFSFSFYYLVNDYLGGNERLLT